MSDVAGIETLTMVLEAGRIVLRWLVTRPWSMPRPLMPNAGRLVQLVGQKINALDYYEAQGQPLSVHLDGCARAAGAKPGLSCRMTARTATTSYESAIREAGFDVFVIPNQGQGAASARIETPPAVPARVLQQKHHGRGPRGAWLVSRKEVDRSRTRYRAWA
jgi:hypothetical protein